MWGIKTRARATKTIASSLLAISCVAALLTALPAQPAAAAGPVQKNVTVVIAQRSGGGTAAHADLDAAITTYLNGRGSTYFQNISGGRVSLKVAGVHRYTTTSYPCGTSSDVPAGTALRDEAVGRGVFTRGPNNLLLVYTPNGASKCKVESLGAADRGGDFAWVGDAEDLKGDGTPYPPSQNVLRESAILHEIGHLFGLGHNGSTRCQGHPDLTESEQGGRCQRSEYGGVGGMDDSATTNGLFPALGELHMVGWATDNDYKLVTTTSTTTINSLTNGSGLRGIRLPSTTGGSYWLDFRNDANWGSNQGVHIIKRYYDGMGTSVVTLATTNDWTSGARNLGVGKSVTLDDGRYTVTTTQQTGSSATVSVTVNKRLAPSPIKSVTATAIPGGVDVAWTHYLPGSDQNTDSFDVYAGEYNGDMTKRATVSGTTTKARLLGLSTEAHYISVIARNTAGINKPNGPGLITPLSTSSLKVDKFTLTAGSSSTSAKATWAYPKLSAEYGTPKMRFENAHTGQVITTAPGATTAQLPFDPTLGFAQYDARPIWTATNGATLNGGWSMVNIDSSQLTPDTPTPKPKPQPATTSYTYRYSHKVTIKKRAWVKRNGKRVKRTVRKTYRYTYTRTKATKWTSSQKRIEKARTKAHAKKRASKAFRSYVLRRR